jgi:hypothetical protein
MKTTSTVIYSLVLILSLTACGGSSENETPPPPEDTTQYYCAPIQLSEWSTCQSNGTRTRTVLAGDCAVTRPLVEACAFCQSIGRVSCVPPSGQSMCCPEVAPFYCPSLTLCYTNATDAVHACTDAMVCDF